MNYVPKPRMLAAGTAARAGLRAKEHDHDVKKLAVILLLAVLGPSLLLAGLAIRAAQEQQASAERQRQVLHQGAVDDLAEDVNAFMTELRRHYLGLFDQLLEENGPESLVSGFDGLVRGRWSQVSLGCVLSEGGEWQSPRLQEKDGRLREFYLRNMGFLSGAAEAEFFLGPDLPREEDTAGLGQERVNLAADKMQTLSYGQRQVANHAALPSLSPPAASAAAPAPVPEEPAKPVPAASPMPTTTAAAGQSDTRSGIPAQPPPQMLEAKALDSRLSAALRGRTEGLLSRYLDDGLHVLLWRRHPGVPGRLFWVELNVAEVRRDLGQLVRRAGEGPRASEVFLALLDASGDVAGRTQLGFVPDWNRPTVMSAVGDSLPRWRVAAYLLDPRGVERSSRLVRLTIWVLTPALVLAILTGSLFVVRDIGREMRLARQKTDFVSQVSHELKTPLTSIRMFSEMLEETGEVEAARRQGYAGVISREAARLGRLIENLLSFARMERGEARYHKKAFDLGRLASQTVETCRFRAESAGLKVACVVEPGDEPLSAEGDADAIAQVLENLISNAEKYAAQGGELRVEVGRGPSPGMAAIRVLDRGPGIPRRLGERVFEKFFRVDDSLSNGVQGSGLGLTLARQIARAHGGDLIHEAREGGGSAFVLVLPLPPSVPA